MQVNIGEHMPGDQTAAAEEDLAAECEALARRAGIDILEDRKAAMLASYRDYRAMTALLHAPRAAAVESASVFSIESIKRG